jgi:hypothetical protein
VRIRYGPDHPLLSGWYPVTSTQRKESVMTDKKVEDKQDAAYGKYEKEQATYERKHPGEINEPAYAKYESAYDKAEGKPAGMMSADRTEQQKKYDAAYTDAMKLSGDAAEAHAKADQSKKTKEQVAAEEADRKASDAHAKAAALHPDAILPDNIPAATAGVMGAVRLNVPGRPGYAAGVPTDDESQTVNLYHISEDGKGKVYTRVHPEMVGDYLRAGWSHV